MNSETKYNKNTYIGYLKVKRGGMKIIPGDIDTTINNKRTKIINHLKKVLSGGKSLKEKNIKKYFKALGGKYIRGGMVGSNEDKNSSIRNADKLLKLSAKQNLPIQKILDYFKGSAPTLYKKLESKIKSNGGGPRSDSGSSGTKSSRGTILTNRTEDSITDLAIDHHYPNLILNNNPQLYEIIITTANTGTVVPVLETATDPRYNVFRAFMKADLSRDLDIKRWFTNNWSSVEKNLKYYVKTKYSDEDISNPEKWQIDDILFWLAFIERKEYSDYTEAERVTRKEGIVTYLDWYWSMFGMYQSGKRGLRPSTSAFRANVANYLIYYLFVNKENSQTYLERINWFIIDPDGNQIINWRAVVISRLLETLYLRLDDLSKVLIIKEKNVSDEFQMACDIRYAVLAKCRKIISNFLKRGAEVKDKFPEDIKNIYNGQDSDILRYFLGENKNNPEYKNTFPAMDKCEEYRDDRTNLTDLNSRGPQEKGGYNKYPKYNGGHERYSRRESYNNNYDGGYNRYNSRESYDNNYERYDNIMYGGELLEQLRIDIGRSKENIELNQLKKEILLLRNQV